MGDWNDRQLFFFFLQITEIEARSALIQLAPPEYDQNEFDIDPADFRYELQLSDKGKDGRYKLVYR